MTRSSVRILAGPASRCGMIAAAALAFGAFTTPADAYSGRICVMGDFSGIGWGIWVEWNFSDVFGNYDPATRAGVIDFNVMTPQSPDDVAFPYVSNGGDLAVLQGPATMAMGTFEVQSGLGTGECVFGLPDIWVTGSNWGVHLIFNAADPVLATMQLTGFTEGGEGIYEAHGLAIPVEFEVTLPDGTVQVMQRTCNALELRTPLDLSPPCPADIDGNGILNLDDVDGFVASFLGGCP